MKYTIQYKNIVVVKRVIQLPSFNAKFEQDVRLNITSK